MEAASGSGFASEVSATAEVVEHPYKGVRRKSGRWVSDIWVPNIRKKIWLGSYESAEKAARAFDVATFCLRGARTEELNFPEFPPNIPRGDLPFTPEQIQTEATKHANCASAAITTTAAAQGLAPTLPESANGAAFYNAAEDVLDWSLAAAALPSPPPLWSPSGACGSARFVPQVEDSMHEFSQLVVPLPGIEEPEDEDDGNKAAFGSVLWNF